MNLGKGHPISSASLVLVALLLTAALFAQSQGRRLARKSNDEWNALPKVGIVITLQEELQPYISLLQLEETRKPFEWMRSQPFHIYEATHNGVFYRVVWNGICPYCDPSYGGTAMMTDQGAIPSSIALLADGFRPDIMLHAGTTGGWTAEWPLNSLGICANGRSIIFAQRNLTDGNPGDLAYGWGNFPCADIPQEILDRHSVRLSTIATIDTYVPTEEGAKAFALFGVDQLEMEGAAVASQAVLYGIPFVKTAAVANSYVDLDSNCPTDTGFQCWNATCWALARATIGVLEDFLVPVDNNNNNGHGHSH